MKVTLNHFHRWKLEFPILFHLHVRCTRVQMVIDGFLFPLSTETVVARALFGIYGTKQACLGLEDYW